MAHDNDKVQNIDDVDTLETLDPLAAIDTVEKGEVIDADTDDDDVQVVHSSDLIEPLESTDVLELDYDEEIPTRVDGKRRKERRETFPPARPDAADIYYLTEERRPSLVLTEDERMEMDEALRPAPLPKVVAPPRRETMLPASTRDTEMSSLAPVAMTPEPELEREQPVAGRHGRRRVWYGSTVAALAAAAAVIALWPTGASTPGSELASKAASMSTRATAAVVNTSEVRIEASEPVVHKLSVVQILADAPKVAGAADQPAAGLAEEPTVRPAPPVDPSGEVVIDDSAQLTGELELPTGETASVGASEAAPMENEPEEEKLEAPTPPANDPLPFDKARAEGAMNAAAGMANACRPEGMVSATARVSVTFAPSGRVTTAVVDGTGLSGTPAGGCVARAFRSIRVDPFAGPPVTVHKSFQF